MVNMQAEISMAERLKKEEVNREKRRNFIIGAIIRKVHKEQGTMSYLLQTVEPYLSKSDRRFLGLPF